MGVQNEEMLEKPIIDPRVYSCSPTRFRQSTFKASKMHWHPSDVDRVYIRQNVPASLSPCISAFVIKEYEAENHRSLISNFTS